VTAIKGVAFLMKGAKVQHLIAKIQAGFIVACKLNPKKPRLCSKRGFCKYEL